MPKIQTYTNLGSIATGDKLLGERVDGTTVRFTYAQATMNGVVNRTTITVGTDTFTFDISSSYIGQSTITTLGTITTGVWNGTTVTVANGGSGVTSHTAYGVITGGTTATGIEQTVTPGTANTFFMSGGTSAIPLWSTSTIPASAGATANKPLVSDGTNYILAGCSISFSPSTAGKRLKSDGTNWITSTTTMPDTGTLGKALIGDGTNYVESTPKFPNASATLNKRIKSDGTDWVASTTTLPDSGTLNKFLVGDGTNYVESTSTLPTSAGAAGKHLKSDGTNYVLTTATISDAPSTSGKILKSDGTNWITSTETYAAPGSSGNVMVSDGTNWTSAAASTSGKPIIQTVFTQTGTKASGSTTMPFDNTIPQSTEGDQYMSQAITPTNSSNILEIEVYAYLSNSTAELTSYALFQDSTANALLSGAMYDGLVNGVDTAYMKYRMAAGTTSVTTFKFRAGRQTSGTVTFNGFNNTAEFNGTLGSYMKITEITV